MERYLRLRDPVHHHALTRDELATLNVEAGFRVEYHSRHQIGRLWQLQVLTARRSRAPLSPHS